jgi:hypothetical protein
MPCVNPADLLALSTRERQQLRSALQTIDGPPPPEWMTTAEVATYLRMSKEALHIAYCRRKEWLPKRYLAGGKYRYRRTDVEASLRPA